MALVSLAGRFERDGADPASADLLLAGCRAQDAASFRAFVVLYQRAVFACLSRIVGGAGGSSVDDLAQETFLRAYRAFPGFDPAGPARVSTWLLTIARADTRREIVVGSRAVAVAEPGAHLRWRGDDVTQDAGDIFYRVERGERFVVHTPAGDVAVLGTCFRVRVETNGSTNRDEERTDMNARDVKVGLVGAASALLATVVVYEGKVAVSQAGQTTSAAASATQLTAGQSARLDASGVHVGAGVGSKTGAAAESAASTGEESLLAANANLSQAIGDYHRRLDAITAEKAALQQKLTSAQQQLAAAGTTRARR